MTDSKIISGRKRFWKVVLGFGAIHFVVMSLGAFLEPAMGGCMFVIPAYFMILPVMLSIQYLQKVGAGACVFLPYAIIGFPLTYYFEYSKMYGLWGVVGWCLLGPLVGLIGDLFFRYLPRRIPEHWRAAFTGSVIGAAIFVTTYIALVALYRNPDYTGHLRFFASAFYFSLPWLIINGGFAGYTALALTKRV